MRNQLTREQRRKGGACWSPAKAASVGAAFEAHNGKQRAAAQARYAKIKLLRENGLRWREVAEFLGESTPSVKALYYKIRDRESANLTTGRGNA